MVLALSCRADFLFLDETFDGLDPILRNLVKKLLYADVAERGCTAVLTSHSLRELEDTCDPARAAAQGRPRAGERRAEAQDHALQGADRL